RLDQVRVDVGGEFGGDVGRLDPLGRDRQQVQPVVTTDFLDQLERLAADEHQGVDVAGAQPLQRDRLGMALNVDLEAEVLEHDARGHEGAAAFGAEVHPLAGQVVDRRDFGPGEHVHFLVVQPGDVVDL